MAATPSVKIVKSFPYKGGTKEWSNRYHFTGNDAPSDAEWDELAGVVYTDERQLYLPAVTIVGAVGYLPGSDVPVWSTSLDLAGEGDFDDSDIPCPGDVVALLRYATDVRTAKNHPVYLFNYYHGALREDGTSDGTSLQQKSALEALATDLTDGTWTDGTNALHRAGPNGAVADGFLAEQYLTHRDFPR